MRRHCLRRTPRIATNEFPNKLNRQLATCNFDPGALFFMLDLEAPGMSDHLLQHALRLRVMTELPQQSTVAHFSLQADVRFRDAFVFSERGCVFAELFEDTSAQKRDCVGPKGSMRVRRDIEQRARLCKLAGCKMRVDQPECQLQIARVGPAACFAIVLDGLVCRFLALELV